MPVALRGHLNQRHVGRAVYAARQMPAEFSFDHVFTAQSPTAVITAYFDPGHLAVQDKVAELIDRTVVEDQDDGQTRRTTWHVRAAKPLPFYVRAFVSGGRLAFRESMVWHRGQNVVELVVTPEILGGRVRLEAKYTLAQVGDHQVKRTYAGTVTADLKLIGGKVEKAVLSEFESGIGAMAKVTQDWLRDHPTGAA